MSRLSDERVQATLDHPYVACCGGCGSRLHCALDEGDGTHGTHTRVERDVYTLAADLLAARASHAALAKAARRYIAATDAFLSDACAGESDHAAALRALDAVLDAAGGGA